MEELSVEVNSTEVGSGEIGSGEEDEDLIELVHVDEDFFYMEHLMRLMAMLHSLVSLAMLIAYYHLKVILEVYLIIHTNTHTHIHACVHIHTHTYISNWCRKEKERWWLTSS